MNTSTSTTKSPGLRAIVLAAGKGARMHPLTENEHKSLLPVGNNTILGRIIDGLISIHVEEIVVVTGYLGERVKDFLSLRYPAMHFQFVENARYKETNNIVSLAMAFEAIPFDRDILLIECDLLFKPEILKHLATARGNIALVDRYRTGMDGTVVTVEGDVITRVYPTHLQPEGFDYGDKFKTLNIYRFDRNFCQSTFHPLLSCYANIIDSGCYYELVLGMLINMQHQVVRVEIVEKHQWAEVDDPNDLAAARFIFEPEERSRILNASWGGYWNFDIVDFTFMRNMYFPTEAMIATSRRALPELMRSYGSTQAVLNGKLALALKCDPSRIQCLSGAAQIYPELRELLPPGPVLLPSPTFGEYARWFQQHETYRDAPGIDLVELEQRAASSAVVVIVNPNNPTGTTLQSEFIYKLAFSLPATRFVVDESFLDFSDQTSLRLLLADKPLPNIIVIASLSKSLGVPGLRLGYAFTCDEQFVLKLGSRLPIWNINSIAEHYLELLPKFRSELAESFRLTADDREDMAKLLEGVDCVSKVYPSGGNFLLVELAPALTPVLSACCDLALRRYGLYLKDVSSKFALPGAWLRVAVRKPADNLKLVSVLSSIFTELKLETGI